MPVMRALLDAWKEDLRYRISRVKARMKFMVDDRGPEGMREEVERRLGYALPDHTLEPLDHDPRRPYGRRARARAGHPTRSVRRVHLGLISGDQMLAVADLAATHGRDIPADPPAEPDRDRHRPLSTSATGPSARSASRSTRTACARRDRLHRRAALQFRRRRDQGTRLGTLIEHLEGRFGHDVSELRLHLDGCPTRAVSTGSATSASRARPCAMPRASAIRATTSCCVAREVRWPRSAGRYPARPDRGAQRDGRAPDRGLARCASPRRELPRVLRPHD